MTKDIAEMTKDVAEMTKNVAEMKKKLRRYKWIAVACNIMSLVAMIIFAVALVS